MTYNVFGGTLNLTQSISQHLVTFFALFIYAIMPVLIMDSNCNPGTSFDF